MASEEPKEVSPFALPQTDGVGTLSNVSVDTIPPSQKHKKKMLWVLVFFVFLLFVGGFFWFFWSPEKDVVIEQPEKRVTNTLTTSESVDEPTESALEARYQSENFRAESIVIGGEAEVYVPEDDLSPLEITDVRGEAFVEKNKQEVRLIVSWRTNKLSRAVIEYTKGAGQIPKTASEDDFGLEHSLTLSGLDQASTYIYTIQSEDRFGGTVTSDQHAVYTGSKTVSLFDLIADAVGEVFGWAVKKNE